MPLSLPRFIGVICFVYSHTTNNVQNLKSQQQSRKLCSNKSSTAKNIGQSEFIWFNLSGVVTCIICVNPCLTNFSEREKYLFILIFSICDIRKYEEIFET